MSSLSLADDKLGQLYQKSATAQPDAYPSSSTAPITHAYPHAYPPLPLNDGNPSYYAEIRDGRVIFGSARPEISSTSALMEGNQAPLGGGVRNTDQSLDRERGEIGVRKQAQT